MAGEREGPAAAEQGKVGGQEEGGLQENLQGGGSPAKAWGGAGPILQPQIKALSQLYRREAWAGGRGTGGRQRKKAASFP